MFQKKLCVAMVVVFCLCMAASLFAEENKKLVKPLRSKPMAVSNDEFKSVFRLNDDAGPLEYASNEFKDNGNGTITDQATGLMWQKSGSDRVKYEEAKEYIRELNSKKFAGYSDWRLPTVDELKTLLSRKEMNGDLYIDPIFDNKQGWCWTSDTCTSGGAWRVGFFMGNIKQGDIDDSSYVRAVRSRQ